MEDWELMLLGLAVGALAAFIYLQTMEPHVETQPPNTYKNLEEWEIQRDITGRLKGIKVHRDARRT